MSVVVVDPKGFCSELVVVSSRGLAAEEYSSAVRVAACGVLFLTKKIELKRQPATDIFILSPGNSN